MEKSDETLMREHQQGNPAALEELFGRYKLKLFNFAYRILSDRAEAEDVTAELFLTLITKAGSYEPRAKFSTWVYAVVRNGCVSKIRRRRSLVFFSQRPEKEEGEEGQWEPVGGEPGPDEQAERKDRAGWVQSALKNLPLPQREAIVLREYQGLSYAEIGEVLHCSLDNVKVMIFRARESLRKELAPILEERPS